MAASSASENDPDFKRLALEVVTPEGQFYSGRASLVELPGAMGELGVYPGHVPLFAELVAGEIRAYAENPAKEAERFVIAGGYVQIGPNVVRVLAYFASPGEEESKIEDACRRAKQALENAGDMPPEQIETDVARLRAELGRVKKPKR